MSRDLRGHAAPGAFTGRENPGSKAADQASPQPGDGRSSSSAIPNARGLRSPATDQPAARKGNGRPTPSFGTGSGAAGQGFGAAPGGASPAVGAGSGASARRRRRLWLVPVIAGALALGAVGGGFVVSRDKNAAAEDSTTDSGNQIAPTDRETATGLAGSPVPSAAPSIEPAPVSVSPTVTATTTTKPSPSASPTVTGRANTAGANLALHKTATTSSVESATWPASAAVDGDMESRWSSGFADPQWITVDLGAVWAINDVRLAWEHAYALHYRVDISLDARHWSTVYKTTAGTDGPREIRLSAATPARYVRMYGTKRVSQYGFSLQEFEVH
ncbi:discoidin domain-containing protein [Paractinoplanes durhamensis]|nr:discoidin domain-containing protein [Actinoplanes durhamensis]